MQPSEATSALVKILTNWLAVSAFGSWIVHSAWMKATIHIALLFSPLFVY